MSRNNTRAAVAILVGIVAMLFRYAEYLRTHGRHGDFGTVWFGARSLLHGVDPYPLVGPGLPFNWDFHLNYPATSMVAVLPLGLLPELAATLLFVGISAALLTLAITRTGWQRIWALPSAAFIVAARAAQWSTIYSAAYLMSSLAWMLSAKPTLGLAIAAAGMSRRTLKLAVAGSIALLAISLALLPTWPLEWIHVVQPGDFRPVITWPGGFFVLLAILRWRLSEGRLLLVMACIPTTSSWYETLPLLMIGRTKRECQLLSLISSVGYIMQGFFASGYEFVEVRYTRPLILAFCYLPALVVVLRRRGSSREAIRNSGSISGAAFAPRYSARPQG